MSEHSPCSGRPRKMWERPHEYEGKIIHVGTPGIFHAPSPEAPLQMTRCGRSMADARSTDHRLLDYSPCVVCFEDSGQPTSTRGFAWWRRQIAWRIRCWRKGYPPEVYKTISPHPPPERAVERLRKRVQTGNWGDPL